ncbi:aminotransferase class I/II-fold pyridoxal phosphate-dependent enzyme [Advenella kashmirensis]|uniref:aminotransferase class I/II-fold pyridoxal phosphate-dependent enzyme n=1 Tax=Advenella kashmirensis TaxID=310575 RepID=UPI0009DADFCC|nr:aminotransferase class I/II-fold pyridoxal phosphate-dependent enzyme [Advenella kashmirensis]
MFATKSQVLPHMYHFYDQYCVEQAAKSRLRALPPVDLPVSFDFSSNDYLGLATHPDVVNAAIEAARQCGAGSTGSRLLSGNYRLIESFERQIALDKQTEAAVIFSSGYQANMTVLASLLSQRVLPAPPIVFLTGSITPVSITRCFYRGPNMCYSSATTWPTCAVSCNSIMWPPGPRLS